MFSNFEPLRGLEPRTHALRMRNWVLKISELECMMKNLYRNNTKKYIKTLTWMIWRIYLGIYFGVVGGDGVGGGGLRIWIGRGR